MLGAPKLKDDLGFLHVVSQYGRKCADWETQKLGLNPISCTNPVQLNPVVLL